MGRGRGGKSGRGSTAYGKTLGSQSFNESIPTAPKGANMLLEFCIFSVGNWRRLLTMREKAEGDAELAVFLFEFVDPMLEKGELGFSAVARVLGGNTVAVSTGLLALI